MRTSIDRAPRGFTLVELITTIAVVGIVLAIALPRLRISEGMEVQLAAMQLAQDLDFSRTRALSTRSQVRVQFAMTAPGEYSAYLDTDMDSVIAATPAERLAMQGFGTRPLPQRVKYGRGSAPAFPGDVGSGAITFDAARVTFDSRGLVAPFGTSGAVYLQHERKTSEVSAVALSAAGSVRVWVYRDGRWQ